MLIYINAYIYKQKIIVFIKHSLNYMYEIYSNYLTISCKNFLKIYFSNNFSYFNANERYYFRLNLTLCFWGVLMWSEI